VAYQTAHCDAESDTLLDLVQLLKLKPEDRLPLVDVMNHPFVTKYKDVKASDFA
jgi:hypothetical protein